MKRKMRKSVMIFLFLVLPFLIGCSERDKGLSINDSIDIEEKVDISSIEYPAKVQIYQVELWKPDPDKIIDTLLCGEISEIQTQWAEGPAYLTAPPENEILNINSDDGPAPAAFSYLYKYTNPDAGLWLDDMFPDNDQIQNEFESASFLTAPIVEDCDVEEMVKIVKTCFEKMDLPEYVLRSYAQTESVDGTKTDMISYWQQEIDQIPVSICSVDVHSDGLQHIYNRTLDYDTDLYGSTGHARVDYVENEIVSMSVSSAIGDYESIDIINPVSPQKAWNKVKSEVYQKRETKDTVLELVELQYLHLEKNEKRYLYPVWTIEVAEMDKSEITGMSHNYYLIDAATGEFFVGIDVE